jgi:hypothetical protein
MAQITKADIDEMADIIRRSNALVGAAPEMLGMLKRCRFVFEDIIIDEQSVEHGLWQGEMLPRLINEIEALIAKAEGHATIPAERSLKK